MRVLSEDNIGEDGKSRGAEVLKCGYDDPVIQGRRSRTRKRSITGLFPLKIPFGNDISHTSLAWKDGWKDGWIRFLTIRWPGHERWKIRDHYHATLFVRIV